MGQKSILNLTKQLNSTKLSRMTHLGIKEPRVIGVSGGGVGVKCENLAKYRVLRDVWWWVGPKNYLFQ